MNVYTVKIKILTILLLLLIPSGIKAQTLDATLIELNYHEDSNPQNFAKSNSGFYFTATDDDYRGTTGRELWFSDGTVEGTLMIKDIFPGKNSSAPQNLLMINGDLFFTANDGVHGAELWKSNGTEAGTIMVKDLRPNNSSQYSGPGNFVDFKGKLYFTATDDINGTELWESDGTESGTFMVKDINPDGVSSYPSDFFIFKNALYFIANDGVHGSELWKSDGTESGTLLLKDINPLSYSGINNGNHFLVLNNEFYFFANDNVNGTELWKSDGTEGGTVMVKNIRTSNGSSASILKGEVINGLMIFEANDGVHGSELWKSDGTESGTVLLKDINNSNYNSITYNSEFIKFNNLIYFVADDGVNGNEIWKTDGTSAGTELLKDINEGNAGIWIDKFYVDEINNKLLFFSTSTNSSDKTIWISDGTSIGTFELSSIKDSNLSGLEENFISINSKTIFTGKNDIYGNELWITDGSISGTSLFKDLSHSNSSLPSKFTDVNGDLFFRARGKEYGNQLFKSNGTIEGTYLVKDINEGYSAIDDKSDMRNINGILFFSAVDGIHGYELWRSDGTEEGTSMVKDIFPGQNSSLRNYNDKQSFTVINNKLYFTANDGVHGFELWTSDGTEEGTFMIKDLRPGGSNVHSYPSDFVLLNGTVYFHSFSNIWKTDGTESGTSVVTNLNGIRELRVVNNKLMIIAETSGTTYGPHDLWVSDGTASGTEHIKSFGDNIDSDIRFMTIMNDELYFVAKSPESFRKAIYKSDGTIEGTELLYDGANHTPPDIDIDDIVTCGDYVYFGIQEGFSSNKELWRTDGTIDGTEMVAGRSTEDFSYIRNMTCFNNSLLYLAESSPQKIWVTSKNINEPVQLDININNGKNFEGYNSIGELGVAGDNLYFSASNDISGTELYVSTTNFSILSVDNYIYSETEGIKELIKIYPNPTNGIINIKSINNSQIESFELFDLSGRKLFKKVNTPLSGEISYNVNFLSKGIYLINIQLLGGNIISAKLIVN